MSLGPLILMVLTLVFVTGGFVFFIIMDFISHKNLKKQNTIDNNEILN